MKIVAHAYSKNTRRHHTIVDGKRLRDIEGDVDGGVTFRLTSAYVSLSGEYWLNFAVSKEELASLVDASTTHHLKQRIELLESQIERLSRKAK